MVRRTLPFLLSLAVAALQAQEAKREDSVRKFAQDFYRWYVPIAAKDNKGTAFEIAIKQRPSSFSPQLLQGLRDDAEAQAKAVGEMVGLDFDPFLNSQDPSNHYVIGQINLKNDGYWVDITLQSQRKRMRKPVSLPWSINPVCIGSLLIFVFQTAVTSWKPFRSSNTIGSNFRNDHRPSGGKM